MNFLGVFIALLIGVFGLDEIDSIQYNDDLTPNKLQLIDLERGQAPYLAGPGGRLPPLRPPQLPTHYHNTDFTQIQFRQRDPQYRHQSARPIKFPKSTRDSPITAYNDDLGDRQRAQRQQYERHLAYKSLHNEDLDSNRDGDGDGYGDDDDVEYRRQRLNDAQTLRSALSSVDILVPPFGDDPTRLSQLSAERNRDHYAGYRPGAGSSDGTGDSGEDGGDYVPSPNVAATYLRPRNVNAGNTNGIIDGNTRRPSEASPTLIAKQLFYAAAPAGIQYLPNGISPASAARGRRPAATYGSPYKRLNAAIQSNQLAYAPERPLDARQLFAPALTVPYPPSFISITTSRPEPASALSDTHGSSDFIGFNLVPGRVRVPDPFYNRQHKSLLDSYIPSWEIRHLLEQPPYDDYYNTIRDRISKRSGRHVKRELPPNGNGNAKQVKGATSHFNSSLARTGKSLALDAEDTMMQE